MQRDWRYRLLGGLLFAIAGFHVANAQWIGDFWNHAAIVRELSLRMRAPHHHLLGVATAHNIYTPFHVIVAGLVRLGVSPVAALGAAALGNLALLLAGIRALLAATGVRRPETAAFYFLLFALLLWGFEPWRWSGFLHLGIFGYVLPYPSTFALALTGFALAVHARFLGDGARWRPAVLALLLATVLVTHPPTALVCYPAAGALLLGQRRRPPRARIVGSALAVAASLLLASAWPYYDVFDLLLAPPAGVEWHVSGRPFYESVLARTFPAWLGLPLIAWRLGRYRRDPLALVFVALLALYAFGFVSGSFGLGRVVSQLVMCAQLALALAITEAEPRLPATARAALPALVLLGALATGNLQTAIGETFRTRFPVTHAQLRFIADHVGPDDIVLALPPQTVLLPAIAGRIVAAQLPVYEVPDHARRRGDVLTFFHPGIARERRLAIARRYGARFALLDLRRIAPGSPLHRELASLGRSVATAGPHELIELPRGAR